MTGGYQETKRRILSKNETGVSIFWTMNGEEREIIILLPPHRKHPEPDSRGDMQLLTGL